MPWKRIVTPHTKPTTVLAYSLRGIDEFVAQDAHRIVGLSLFHGGIFGILKMGLHGIHAIVAQCCAIPSSDGFVVGKILISSRIDPPKGDVADAPLGPSQDAVRQRLRQGFEEQVTQLHSDFPTGGDRGRMPCRHHTPRTGTDINESIKTVVDWNIRIDEAF